MPGEIVYVCPDCREYVEKDEYDDGEKKCSNEECENEGGVLQIMYLCPKCREIFEEKELLKKHAKEEH